MSIGTRPGKRKYVVCIGTRPEKRKYVVGIGTRPLSPGGFQCFTEVSVVGGLVRETAAVFTCMPFRLRQRVREGLWGQGVGDRGAEGSLDTLCSPDGVVCAWGARGGHPVVSQRPRPAEG